MTIEEIVVKSMEYELQVCGIHANQRIREAYVEGAKWALEKLEKEKLELKWHKLDWDKDFPKAGQLLRVRTHGGMEYICVPDYYEPAEDEIGYGEVVIQFYNLKGEWVDDNEIEYWCELPTFNKNLEV